MANKTNSYYENIKAFFSSKQCGLIDDLQTINQTGRIRYKCWIYHENSLVVGSLNNKRSYIKKFPEEERYVYICSQCVTAKNNIDKLEAKNVDLKNYGSEHEIISYVTNKNITYICGNCGEFSHSSWGNLERSCKKKEPDKCTDCSGSFQRKNYTELVEEVERTGCTLLTKEHEYTNNKELYVLCKCGDDWFASLHDIKRSRNCVKCGYLKIENSSSRIFSYQGSSWKIRGYEDRGIVYQIDEEKIDPKDIKTGIKNVPNIEYSCNGCKKCINDSFKHTYYTDIFIEPLRKIIEVKCIWTYFTDNKLKRKLLQCVEENYNVELFIYDAKDLVFKIEVTDEESFREADECVKPLLEKYGKMK